jgi:dephospho-CoA kinase
VSCAPEVQRARLMARDGAGAADAEARIAAQMPLVEKERVATAVIRNDAGEAELRDAVTTAWGPSLA